MDQTRGVPPVDQWQHVATEIQDRLSELAFEALVAQTGLSRSSVVSYLEGDPISDVDHRERIASALTWRPDAVENLLAGEFATDQVAVRLG